MKIYKIAKNDEPYKIILITPAGSKQIGKENADSEKQAKMFFLKKNTSYRDYLSMGYAIHAILDWKELERRQAIKGYKERRQEDQVQNAWWNK